MPAADQFDVFISYSSKDKAWVRGELLSRIEAAGLKVFIDYRDFTRGAPSIKECERGVVTCRKTLLILTPDYTASEWGEFENIMVQTLDPANRELRLIPLLKAECQKPLRIGALTHIDFTDGADRDLAWRQLLIALGKPPELEAQKEPRPDKWFLAHPYPMPPNFMGRVAERKMLTRWLDTDATHPLLSIRALGGFGKSALVWHWLTHDVSPIAWPRVVWWSFYEGDGSFDHFLAETVGYISGGTIDATKISGKNVVTRLLHALHEPGMLLVLDGFERVLRAFGGLDAAYQGDEGKHEGNDRDCISPLAEFFLYNVSLQPHLWSKVLLTTRLRPRVLEAKSGGLLAGCCEEPLKQMQPSDAVTFFRAEGIRGTHTEIKRACAPYGYHPLSLRLLAGLIMRDFQHPGDIAAAKRLDVDGELVQRRHHVLQVAFDSLAPAKQALLGRIACFRSPVAYDTLKALAATNAKPKVPKTGSSNKGSSSALPGDPALELDADLHDLVARGLLHHDMREGRFDLHPIVRRYAYDRLAGPDRADEHTRLRDYFEAVPKAETVTRLEDLGPVIELYHHTVRAGQLDKACVLYQERLNRPLYFQLGAYQLIIDLMRPLFADGEESPPRLKDESAQAWTLAALANCYSHNGQPRRAVSLFEQQIVIREKHGAKRSLATAFGNLAHCQVEIGLLRAAEGSLRQRVALAQEIKNERSEGIGKRDLGLLLARRGAYAESETQLATALKMFEKLNTLQSQSITWAYRALHRLLKLRQVACDDNPRSEPTSLKPLTSARRSLKLTDEDTRTRYPHERDYVRAHWLLGAACRVAGLPDEAERHLHEALERCRRISMVDYEAEILIELARLRAAMNVADEAQRLADEARIIAERSGYVLQGADAHLELAKLAMARGNRAAALQHAEEAHRLATCGGPPDYTYAAAYAEAAALLAQLKSQ